MSGITGPGLEPGNEHERDSVVVDTRGAVLLDSVSACLVEYTGATTGQAYAVELAGRVNKSSARAKLLALVDSDGLGDLITDLLMVAARAGDHTVVDRVLARLEPLT